MLKEIRREQISIRPNSKFLLSNFVVRSETGQRTLTGQKPQNFHWGQYFLFQKNHVACACLQSITEIEEHSAHLIAE